MDKPIQQNIDRQLQWPIEQTIHLAEKIPQQYTSRALHNDENLRRTILTNLAVGDQAKLHVTNSSNNKGHQPSFVLQNETPPLSLLFGQTNKDDLDQRKTNPYGISGQIPAIEGKHILGFINMETPAQKSALTTNEMGRTTLYPGNVTKLPNLYGSIAQETNELEAIQNSNSYALIHDSRWINLGFWETIRAHPQGKKINKILDTKIWVSINITATLVAMFADDFMKAVLPKQVKPKRCIQTILLNTSFLLLRRCVLISDNGEKLTYSSTLYVHMFAFLITYYNENFIFDVFPTQFY